MLEMTGRISPAEPLDAEEEAPSEENVAVFPECKDEALSELVPEEDSPDELVSPPLPQEERPTSKDKAKTKIHFFIDDPFDKI